MEYSKKFSAKVISVYANNKMIIDALTENSFWLGRYLCDNIPDIDPKQILSCSTIEQAKKIAQTAKDKKELYHLWLREKISKSH